MGYLISFHSLQVLQDDFARSHDVPLDKHRQAGPIPGDTKVQYFLMFVLGADREGLITPCGPPISIEIVAGATDLFEKEWPVGARIYDAVEFGGKPQALRWIAGLVDLRHG
jgi:hypothetical protein